MSAFREAFHDDEWFSFVMNSAESLAKRAQSDPIVATVLDIYYFMSEFKDGGLLQYAQSYSADRVKELAAAFSQVGFTAGLEAIDYLKSDLGCFDLSDLSDYAKRNAAISIKYGDELLSDPFEMFSLAFSDALSELDHRIEEVMLGNKDSFAGAENRYQKLLERPSLRKLVRHLNEGKK